jgi:probable aminopeptidase NPEPL1
MADLVFVSSVRDALAGADRLLVLVPDRRRKDGWLEKALPDRPWRRFLVAAGEGREAGPSGRAFPAVNPDGSPRRLVLGLLPDTVSRHNTPTRFEAAAAIAAGADLGSEGGAVIACVEDPEHAPALARAVARATPLFQRATGGQNGKAAKKAKKARIAFLALDTKGRPVKVPRGEQEVVQVARWAAELVDTPTNELTTAALEKAVRKAFQGVPHVKVKSIVGEELLEKRLAGIHAVGRAAVVPPRLVVVEYKPPRAKRTVSLVGKGIVYDTGGLSLKPTTSMTSMKADMGGAAAAAGATLALARGKAPVHVVCALALAENAIGPDSYRNDDIITFHSGKTVEINNTDAEGRLILADAVSYVARRHEPDAIVDAATLTGAQLVATGIRHAAVMSNREGLERLAVEAGRDTGDLTFPLPFAPEFFQDEFRSKVADMKNSVANRSNAQSSCAAQFIYSHIQDLDVPWLHVDLAGPAFRDERGTGYGVALLARIASSVDDEALAH